MDNKEQVAVIDPITTITEQDNNPGLVISLKDNNPFNRQVGGSHYQRHKIQPTEFIMVNNIPWAEGNIIKYACRWRAKGGPSDLRKLIHYAEILLKEAEGEKETKPAGGAAGV